MRVDGALLFSYPGSKHRLAPQYQRLYPRHRVFVDLFGGSGAVIARQAQRATEIYNDLDSSVVNVFTVIKDVAGRDHVLRLLKDSATDRRQYDHCKAVLADERESSARRAWAFIVAGTVGFGGHPALVYGWIKQERQRRDLRNLAAKVLWWHDRLRNVHLVNKTWSEVIDQYDSPDTLFFADPPYLAQVLRRPREQYYRHVMDVDAHIELIERLRTIEGRCILCGYNHPAYTELLFYWRKFCFSARETMGGKRAGRRQEIAWLDYENDGSKIEGNRLRIAGRFVNIMGGQEQAVRYLERIKRLQQLPK
jgi:DNA adenine methylase